MKQPRQLSPDEQSEMLAERYSLRAEAYDAFWSPVILPVAQRLLSHLPLSTADEIIDVGTGAGALLPAIQKAAAEATVLGVDRSEGMLRLAKKKHAGPLALMDVQKLDLAGGRFDVGIVAFVLFHLPSPERCLSEVNRVLKPGGMVGTVTWSVEHSPPANAVWDEELDAAGAHVLELPATDHRACCDSLEKMTALLDHAGFISPRVWSESIEHQWRPADHFEYQVSSTSRLRLQSLDERVREDCLRLVRDRVSRLGEDHYVFRGEVIMATATKRR